MNLFRFAAPWAFTLIPVALASAWWMGRRRRRGDARLRLPAAGAVLRLGKSPWQRLDALLPWLRGLVLLLIVGALARPQAGSKLLTVTTYGVDIVVALDVSRSMLAEDFRPSNRLEVAKQVVQQFVEGRESDRIGLVVFAGSAVTRCPLTTDHPMLQQFLEEIEVAPPEQSNTAIGRGLATAVNRLRRSDARSRVVVLVTDGRNNAGEIGPETAAEAARALGVRVYTIGVGTTGEVPFPVDYGPLGTRYQMHRVDLDEELLREIARETEGRYFRATDPETLAEAFHTIDELEQTKIESRERILHAELFSWLLLPALALFLFERWLATTRLRRIP